MTPSEEGLRFECEGDTLVGVLSLPAATRSAPSGLGVVIAVGGPQYRAGSHRQFVLLARRLASAGHAVLRFDFRGMGDSAGIFPGFEHVGPDLAAATHALKRGASGVTRVVVWGLCDAASAALMNTGSAPAWAGLVLLNPWVRHVDTQARTAVKRYYAQRIIDPVFWRKLAMGEVRFGEATQEFTSKVWRMLRSYMRPSKVDDGLLDYRERMARGALSFVGLSLYILSGRDHVCDEFLEYVGSHAGLSQLWTRPGISRLDLPVADHTFSSAELRSRVEDATLAFLDAVASSAPPEVRL